MSESPVVAVQIIADPKGVTKAINETIREVSLLGKSIDAQNDIAVKTWKKAADAANQYLSAVGATHQQHLRLDVAVRSTEDRINSMAEHYARAGERGERALSNLMRTGELTGRSMNNLMNAAGDLGFAFGPEGALASGIMMIGVAIAQHLSSAEEKMEEVADKFEHHVNEMLSDGSMVEAAKASARAYVTELEALSKEKRTAERASLDHFGMGTNLMPILKAELTRPGAMFASDDAAVAGAEGVGSDVAAAHLAAISVHDRELDRLKRDRKEANEDIARAQEKLAGLERKGHEHEYAAAVQARSDAESRLRQAEARTRQLESERQRLVSAETRGLPAAEAAALQLGAEKSYTAADVTGEHDERDHAIARGAGEKAGRTADEKAREARRVADERAKAEKQAGVELTRLREETTEDAVKAIGLQEVAEAMRIRAEKDRRLQEIDDMKVSDDMKADLRQAAADREVAQMAALNARVVAEKVRYDKEQEKLSQAADAKKKQAAEARNQLIAGVEHNMIDVLIHGQKDMGRKLLAAMLDPEVKHLEALSAKQLSMSAADAVAGNWIGAAKHAGAGALYLAGASAVASFGASGGGGGGGGGGSSAGVGANLASRGGGSGDQIIKIEIVNVTKDQNGREVARTNQAIQRLNDRNVPIRVSL